jgi:hypothetical protein
MISWFHECKRTNNVMLDLFCKMSFGGLTFGETSWHFLIPTQVHVLRLEHGRHGESEESSLHGDEVRQLSLPH